MRRALLALAALLTLAPVAEARVCVVMNFADAGAPVASDPTEALVTGVLQAYGVEYDVLPWSCPGLDTTAYRNGYVRDTTSRSGVQYTAFIHAAWQSAGVTASFPTKRANYMTTNVRWPLVPHVFVGQPNHSSIQPWHAGAGIDSIGCATVPATANYYQYREYDAATGASWSVGNGNGLWADLDQAPHNPKNVYRPILKVGASPVQIQIAGTTPAWKEQVATPALYSTVDTCRLWVKYGSTDNGIPQTRSPCIFLEGAGYAGDAFPLIAALAIADSATGGQIFTDATKLPQRASVTIGPWFATSTYANVSHKNGMFCRSDSCDTANVSITIDSLIAIGMRGSIGVQTDSISALSYQKPYLQKLLNTGNWKVTLQEWTGTIAPVSTPLLNARSGNPRRIVDPLGTTRTRTLIPPSATTLPCACPDADSSIYCLVKSAYAVLDSVFPGYVDRTLTAPGGIPTSAQGWTRSITRANGRTLDSLIWVLYHAGVRAIETDPLDYGPAQSGSGVGSLMQNSGYLTVWDSAGTYSAGGARYRKALYRMPIVAIRGYEVTGAVSGQIAGHQITEEFQWGRFADPWYNIAGAGPFWNHNFQTRISAFRVGTSAIGGSGQGTTAQRPGWWQIRKLKLQSDVINRLAGRTLWQWDYPYQNAKARLDR